MIWSRTIRRNAIKLEGDRSSALDLARGRLVLISAFFVLAYMMMVARAVDLGVIQANTGGENTGDEYAQTAPAEIMRADITDRNGELLATTIKTASLYADPHLIADPVAASKGLAEIFPGLSYGNVLQDLQSKKRFVWIRRNITPQEQYKVLTLGEPGLSFKTESRRFYPQGKLGAHLVGYTDIDNHGLAGAERNFDNLLAGGQDLALTLDVRLQHVLHREVSRAMNEFSAKAGFGVIMDVRSGEVLAGISLPDFNPDNPPGRKNDQAMFNRLTLGAYELGSVFKIFSTAAFLETHDVPMSATFDAREPLKEGRFTISDYHAEKRILTIPEIFMYSSNIGAAMMGQATGTEKLKSFYKDVGLLTPMEFEIREIASPLVPSPWRDINTLTASYGHGLATTPLQMVAAVSSIINGGMLVRPKLVLNEDADLPQKGNQIRICSPQTAHRIRQLMRLVVTDGTGKQAEVPGYRVGGKTGTAEKPGRNGGYDSKRLISSFIGVFPVEAPQYAVYIAIDEPQGTKESFGYATGGWVTAPAVARTIASMGSILGIPTHKVPEAQDLGASLKQFVAVKRDG